MGIHRPYYITVHIYVGVHFCDIQMYLYYHWISKYQKGKGLNPINQFKLAISFFLVQNQDMVICPGER